MTTTAHKLYNARELAEALGVKPGFVRTLIRKGFKMPLGVSTPARVHAFLAELEAKNAAVSHRDRERQPAADQPSEQP